MHSAALMLLNYLSSAVLVRFEGTLNTELKLSHTCGKEGCSGMTGYVCRFLDCSQPERYKYLKVMTRSVVAK